jgi:hypothetical protein
MVNSFKSQEKKVVLIKTDSKGRYICGIIDSIEDAHRLIRIRENEEDFDFSVSKWIITSNKDPDIMYTIVQDIPLFSDKKNGFLLPQKNGSIKSKNYSEVLSSGRTAEIEIKIMKILNDNPDSHYSRTELSNIIKEKDTNLTLAISRLEFQKKIKNVGNFKTFAGSKYSSGHYQKV